MDFDRKKIFGFAAVFSVLISVYLYTIAPTVSLWDCGEFIACSHILGVPHPPGTPFYVLLGRLFDIFLPFREVAKRINLISALSSAIACGFLYLIILKVVGRFKENRKNELTLGVYLISVFISIGAGLLFSVWDSSVEAEVYATSLLIVTVGLWLILHWSDNRGMKGDHNYLLLFVYLLALSFGIHLLPLLLIPGVLVFLLLTDWKVFKNPKLISFAVLLIVIGVSTYLYLLIRAQANPGVNEVNPTTWAKLWDVISREQYGNEGIFGLFTRHTSWQTNYGFIRALLEQIKVFFRYFSWQFFPYPRVDTGVLLRWVSLFGTYMYVLIGLWGMYVHFKKDKESFWLFFILFILLSFGLVFYLNHEFSPSDPNPAHQPREPRERDYFWGASFFLFMFYVFMGIYWILGWLKKRNPRYAWTGIMLSCVLGIAPFISNINSHVNRRGNWFAHDYAHNILVGADDYSIIFTYGDNDTFPVWFLQEVKNFRKFDPEKKKGVRLGNFSLMNTNWYIKELKRAGIPIDFASPFIGTRYFSAYNRQKRSGETNKDFEDWVIDTIGAMRVDVNRIIELKDMAVKSIILSAIGEKPSLEDFLMEDSLFVEKYVNNENFNPSINIYFSSPLPPDYRRAFEDHLLSEGYVYKLVKEKVGFLSNRKKMWDLVQNKFAYSYYENFWVRIESRAQVTAVINQAFVLLSFGAEVFSDIYPDFFSGDISEVDRDTLKMLQSVFNKACIYLEDERVFLSSAINIIDAQKLICNELKNCDEQLKFVNSFLQIKDVPRLHLLRSELYIVKANNAETEEERKNILAMAETDLQSLLFKKGWELFAYKALVEVYYNSGESEKFEKIIDELVRDQHLLLTVLKLLSREDVASAIALTEKLQNRFPEDKSLEGLLRTLRSDKNRVFNP